MSELTLENEGFPEEDQQYSEFDDGPRVPRRQIGRNPGISVEPSFDIKLAGHVIGTVYPKRLKGGAQIDLEDAVSTRQVIKWVVNYASGDAEAIEEIIRSLPLWDITTFVRSVAGALESSIQLGNKRGPRS